MSAGAQQAVEHEQVGVTATGERQPGAQEKYSPQRRSTSRTMSGSISSGAG